MTKKNISRILTAALAIAGAQAANANVDDVAMRNKVEIATKYFEKVWSQTFAKRGARYKSPRVIAYAGSVSTACGTLHSNNASYCPLDNSIYYDAVFFTGMMKAAANYLHTDGDYAPIVILAHEWGHAAQRQLNSESYFGLLRENMADCLAGAITLQAKQDGYLDPGDLEEARFALATGGDEPGKTWIFDNNAHGSAKARIDEFMKGYQRGVGACEVFESSRLGSDNDNGAEVGRAILDLLRGIETSSK